MNTLQGGGSAKRFHRKTSTLLTEINVTPFVDVMLVLLIIFMVTTPLLSSGVDIDLPQEDTGAMDIQDGNIVDIRLGKDGTPEYFFEEKGTKAKRITPKALVSRLKNIKAQSAKAEVYLKADKRLSYGEVMATMALVKNAGIERLGMVTEIGIK